MERLESLWLDLRWPVDADCEQVFRALTQPDQLATWWGPLGFTIPEIELDLRVGGRYRFGMQPPEGEMFHLVGEFLEVDPPRRLVYSFRWEPPDPDDQETVVTITLTEIPGGAEIALSQGEFATPERLALHMNGWTESLTKLRELLAST